ncbi:hypothetical protein GCM10010404_80070 [Nonomuraea africana]|uniref:Catechol 2,3-dioxygenase-like lactoylglutathione lyase family enzyme n=1 Tax=Nonomuraea africana TaxID=46171 RepID=A0ABR9KRB7_9ACTN|nr:DUF4328 domain-containing protein [Nonomuraea africana]MBE1564569.1 catechol 2,3-dioxygenase-like lactoylglutathione lyase family enzyme [Nonomuraea africana]
MPACSLRPIRPFAALVVVVIALVAVASVAMSLAHLLHGAIWRLRYPLIYLPAGFAFVCWLARARANAYAISPGVFHTYAAPFVVVGWVLPVVNLFVPKGIVDDIWATSRPGGQPSGTDLVRVRRSKLVWAWWVSWLGLVAVHAYSVRSAPGPVVSVATIVLSLAAGALAIGVVLTITRFQEEARTKGTFVPAQRLGLVPVVVRDQDEAVAFYVGTLGFDLCEDRTGEDGERWVTVRPHHAKETALLLVRGAAPAGERRLVLHTDDFELDHGRMASAGVAFDAAPRREFYGTVASFSDPDGNRWDLLSSPAR